MDRVAKQRDVRNVNKMLSAAYDDHRWDEKLVLQVGAALIKILLDRATVYDLQSRSSSAALSHSIETKGGTGSKGGFGSIGMIRMEQVPSFLPSFPPAHLPTVPRIHLPTIPHSHLGSGVAAPPSDPALPGSSTPHWTPRAASNPRRDLQILHASSCQCWEP